MNGEISKHEWEKWKKGMPIFIVSEGEILDEIVEDCPICHGEGLIRVPFNDNLIMDCPGIEVN